jgi:hypothetical protein
MNLVTKLLIGAVSVSAVKVHSSPEWEEKVSTIRGEIATLLEDFDWEKTDTATATATAAATATATATATAAAAAAAVEEAPELSQL